MDNITILVREVQRNLWKEVLCRMDMDGARQKVSELHNRHVPSSRIMSMDMVIMLTVPGEVQCTNIKEK